MSLLINTYNITGTGIRGRRKHDKLMLTIKGKNIEAIEKSIATHITYSEMYKWEIEAKEPTI